MKRRILVLIAALIISVSWTLGGCGHPPAAPANPENPSRTVTMGPGGEASPEATTGETQPPDAELPEALRIPGQTMQDLCPTEDGWLLLSEGEAPEGAQGWGRFLTPLDEKLQPGTHEPWNGGTPAAILRADGHFWVLCDADDQGGAAVYRDHEPWLALGDGFSQEAQLAWEDGSLYTVMNFRLWIDGRRVEPPQTGGVRYNVNCVLRAGGRMYALVSGWADGSGSVGRWLCPIGPDTEQLVLPEQILPIPEDAFISCWNENGAWLVSGSRLYQTDGVGCEEVCDLGALGVNTSYSILKRLLVCPDGSFLAVNPEGILRVDPRRSGGKSLRIGLYHSDYEAKEAVTAFNRAGTQWRISTRSFSDAESLNLALLNGELDLLCVNSRELLRNYGEKGLLSPIDRSVTDQVLPNVVRLCSQNGACLYLPRRVNLEGCSIPAGLVERPEELESLEALMALLDERCPRTYELQVKDGTLNEILQICGDAWIDRENGTARFTDPSFLTVLRFCNRFMESWEAVAANQTNSDSERNDFARLLSDQIELSGYCWQQQDDPETGRAARIFFRFPAGQGTGFTLSHASFYAVVRGGDEAGGQAFLNYLFNGPWFDEPEYPADWVSVRYPTQLERFQANFEHDSADYADDPARETAAAEWRSLLEGADSFSDAMSSELYTVVLEEAQAYFNGDCSAEEAARRIQNRVEIYLAERD